MHRVAFVSDDGVGKCAAFHVHTELVVLRSVAGHDFEQALLGPRRSFCVGEHFAFVEVVGKAVENRGEVLLGEVAHDLEDALAHHAEETLLVVGDVGGGLVGTESLLRFVFGGTCFQTLLVVFGVGHLFPFFQQA